VVESLPSKHRAPNSNCSCLFIHSNTVLQAYNICKCKLYKNQEARRGNTSPLKSPPPSDTCLEAEHGKGMVTDVNLRNHEDDGVSKANREV
jgi:hypothetical protein